VKCIEVAQYRRSFVKNCDLFKNTLHHGVSFVSEVGLFVA
jgi:hypothetical protein